MKSGKSVIRTETADSLAGKVLLVIGDAVVVDGHIVTACGALDGWQWMREYLKILDAV